MDAVRVALGVSLLLGCCLGVIPAAGAGETVGTPAATAATPLAATTMTTPTAATPTTTPRQQTGGSDTAAKTSDSDGFTVTTTLNRTPDQVGEISVQVAVSIPDRVTQLTASVPDRARVNGATGFSHAGGDNYSWDGETAGPTITYRVNPNRLSDREGPLSVDGDYLFADTESWALVRIPQTGITGRYTGQRSIDLDRETVIDGSGVAGDRMAFLGPTEVQTRRAHGQTFRLVIPAAAQLEANPEGILDSVANAANRLRVGDRDATVLLIAAPTGEVGWTVRGLQVGESDLWVRDTEGVDTASNVWVHEYVHTRQAYTTAPSAEWLTEGSATYYAALLPLETGRVGFETFRRQLAAGATASQRRVVLSDPSRWHTFANYRKGGLVTGELDRRIRLATDREATFETVIRTLNTAEEPVDSRAVRRAVSSAATRDVAAIADQYTTTTTGPSMWNSTAHAAAFDGAPARFRYRLADNPVTVVGPTRTTALSGRALTIVAGETLRINLTVKNIGGTAGDYSLPSRVAGSETIASGRLRPGEQATHSLTQTFTEPGTYQLTAGSDTITISVTEADGAGDGGTINSTPPAFDDEVIEGTADNDTEGEQNSTTPPTTETDDTTPGFGADVAVVALWLIAGSLAAGCQQQRD